MIMTHDDIVKEYLEAKVPMKQIAILADQNLCKKKEIVAILLEAGCDVPKQYLPKEKKAEAAPDPTPQETPFEEQMKLAALEAIERMLPEEDCSGGEAITFISKIHAIIGFMKEVCK